MHYKDSNLFMKHMIYTLLVMCIAGAVCFTCAQDGDTQQQEDLRILLDMQDGKKSAPATVQRDTARKDTARAKRAIAPAAGFKDGPANTMIYSVDSTAGMRMKVLGEGFIQKEKKDSSMSPVFGLNTINIREMKFPPKPNCGTLPPVWSERYFMKYEGRVSVTIVAGDSAVRKLTEETQRPGSYGVYWDGVDERGAKVFGEFECRITTMLSNQNEKVQAFKIKVEK